MTNQIELTVDDLVNLNKIAEERVLSHQNCELLSSNRTVVTANVVNALNILESVEIEAAASENLIKLAARVALIRETIIKSEIRG
jgi:hypothetical protein